MSQTFPIVFSIFGMIALGYGAARAGLLAQSVGQGLMDFVFHLAIPIMLFNTLAAADLHGLSPWRVWAAYFGAFAVVWVVADQMVRRVFGRDARAGVVGGGSAAFANSVLFAVPLIQIAFGEAGTVYVIAVVSVHLAILMIASLVLNERALRTDGITAPHRRKSEQLRQIALALVRHPIVLAIAAGAAWRATGLPVPMPATLILEPLGRSAGPLALFASGMALVNYGMARQIRPALAVAVLKLVLMPALVFAASRAVGLPPVGVAAVTLTAACPTGVNVLIMASQLGTGQALASNAVLYSTAGGTITVSLWVLGLKAMLG